MNNRKLQLALLFISLIVSAGYIHFFYLPEIEHDHNLYGREYAKDEAYVLDKNISNAIYDNDIETLRALLIDKEDYFGADDQKLFYSELGYNFFIGVIELDTLKFLHTYGLNLNDLRSVEVAYKVAPLLLKHGIELKHGDLAMLPPELRSIIEAKDLDLEYYDESSRNGYYGEYLANNLSAKEAVETILWILDNGYQAKKLELGFSLATLLARQDVEVSVADIAHLKKRGLKLYSSYDNRRLHNELNSYAVLNAMVLSGKMDDMALLKALQDVGMNIYSLNFFEYGPLHSLCVSRDSSFIKAHKQGLENLAALNITIQGKDLSSCYKDDLEALADVDFRSSSGVIKKALTQNDKGIRSLAWLEFFKHPITGIYGLFMYSFGAFLLLIFIVIIVSLLFFKIAMRPKER